MKRKGENDVQVESYRNHSILLNKVTSKFVVQELADIPDQDTITAARNAIDRHIKELNAGVRRKVLSFNERYYGNDEAREISEGQLTSWTRARGYSNRIEGIVMFGKDRRELSPDSIFEDTAENRELMKRVTEIDREVNKLRKDAQHIIEKKLKRAELPAHLKESAE